MANEQIVVDRNLHLEWVGEVVWNFVMSPATITLFKRAFSPFATALFLLPFPTLFFHALPVLALIRGHVLGLQAEIGAVAGFVVGTVGMWHDDVVE